MVDDELEYIEIEDLVDDELEYIEIEDLVDDGVYYCTSCYKDLSLSDDEVIEILKSNN